MGFILANIAVLGPNDEPIIHDVTTEKSAVYINIIHRMQPKGKLWFLRRSNSGLIRFKSIYLEVNIWFRLI